jgi:Uma2 family endonuclease
VAEAAQRVVLFSAEDYLQSENDGTWRHEFVNGVVFAMAGASDQHSLIVLNLASALSAGLPDRCQVFASEMKVQIRAGKDERFYYPDVLVSCSPTDRQRFTREEPAFIAEVLSDATERIDRGEKFEAYKTIASLQEYAILSQEEIRLELFRRRSGWEREVFGPDDAVRFESVDLTVKLSALYRRTGLLGSQ